MLGEILGCGWGAKLSWVAHKRKGWNEQYCHNLHSSRKARQVVRNDITKMWVENSRENDWSSVPKKSLKFNIKGAPMCIYANELYQTELNLMLQTLVLLLLRLRSAPETTFYFHFTESTDENNFSPSPHCPLRTPKNSNSNKRSSRRDKSQSKMKMKAQGSGSRKSYWTII